MKAKKKETNKLKDVLQELSFAEDETFFLYAHKDGGDIETTIKQIDKKFLNKNVLVIQSNYGGQEHNYSCFRFVLE